MVSQLVTKLIILDTYHSALVLCNVLDLLTFCIEAHGYHMRNHCLHKDILKRVLILLHSAHKFLVLTALRVLRKVLQLKEEFYHRYIVKNDLFDPVVKLFTSNGHRYNMIDSAVIEMFEYIITEDIVSLISYTVKTHWDALGKVTYVNTFKRLKERFDVSSRPNRNDAPSIFGTAMSSGM